NTGKYLNALEWNEKMEEPNTVVVDMRNHYESEVGHFHGALTPDVDTFREELKVVENILEKDKNKNVLMYCTGGIRCEKATAYMKHLGFENVYHLEGGIIKYARDIKEQGLENKFRGVNFVFDERLAERISDEVIANCHQCGAPFDLHTNCANLACHILFIQCPSCKESFENCCSEKCKSIIHLPIEEQRKIRKEKPVNRNVFKKGRFPIQDVNS
ncbi:MAG: rhodanese-related sulfurtransferase, partial [Bacteroidota bacterium]